jgi:hypothetical protein
LHQPPQPNKACRERRHCRQLQSQSATNEFSQTCRGRFLRARSVQPVGLVVHEDLCSSSTDKGRPPCLTIVSASRRSSRPSC